MWACTSHYCICHRPAFAAAWQAAVAFFSSASLTQPAPFGRGTPWHGLPESSLAALWAAFWVQALDQRTPATAMLPLGGRAAAVATTVQRQPRGARFSFATAGNGAAAAMFDLDGWVLFIACMGCPMQWSAFFKTSASSRSGRGMRLVYTRLPQLQVDAQLPAGSAVHEQKSEEGSPWPCLACT
jgi:hypothetical protein